MLYDNLKQACTEKGITVTGLLNSLGISTANGTFWKNGSYPKGDIIIKLAQSLDVSTDFLLLGKSEHNANLSTKEMELLNYCKFLNEIQIEKVISYVQGLADQNSPEEKEAVS